MADPPLPPTSRPWFPVLEGADAERALQAARDIGHDLAARPVAEGNAGVAAGSAGLALFHAAAADALGDAALAAACERALSAAFDAAATLPMGPSLYSGITGVAWAANRLAPGEGEDDPFAVVDALLAERAALSPWPDHYDLVSGIVGMGVYALERLPRPASRRTLELIVDRLEETARALPGGVAWHTAHALLPGHQRPSAPDGLYNLGVAHGVPGVIALLGLMHGAGIERARTARLLERAVHWLLAQRLPEGAGARMPFHYFPGRPAAPARTAWCYGDPGVAAALLVAARGAGEPAWEREALALARHAADRPAEACGIIDAGLCHGAAGVAHLYNRMHQETGDERLRAAAREWVLRALELRRPGQGVGGFLSHEPVSDAASGWVAAPGILTGAAGIGLALVSAALPVPAEWDALLLARPPRP